MIKLTLITIVAFIIMFVANKPTDIHRTPIYKVRKNVGVATSEGLKYEDEFTGFTCYLMFTDNGIRCAYL